MKRFPSGWRLVLASIVCLLLGGLSVPAFAARPSSATTNTGTGGFNITTSPLPVQLSTTPGGVVNTSLRVENSGTAPVKIKVSLLKFKAASDDGRPLLLKRQPGDTFFDWVTFSKDDFVAQPGVWNDIAMTINPPKQAAFGYYYAVVFSQDTGGQTPTAPNTSQLNGATATLILLNVQAPGEKRQLTVTSFKSSRGLYEYLPATFSVTVHNGGNIYTAPTGNIFISRDHVHDIAVLNVNSGGGNILPKSNRIFQATWSDGFPVFATKRDHGQIISDNQGKPIEQLQWNSNRVGKFRFGHYYAHLLLVYDNGTRDVPINAEVGFWVLPWKILPLILGLLILLVVGLFSSGRVILHTMRKSRRKR